MPQKKDPDTTPGVKLLRMFRELMVSGKKHYLSDMADKLNCSPQTVMRIASEIEYVLGTNFETGLDGNRRWYCLRTSNRRSLGLDSEEVRYLSLCRDLSVNILPETVLERVDNTIFNLAMGTTQKPLLEFLGKGRIDYKPHFHKIEKLVTAVEKNLVCSLIYKASLKKEPRSYNFARKKW